MENQISVQVLNNIHIHDISNNNNRKKINEMELLKLGFLQKNNNQIKTIYFFISELGFIFLLGIIILLLYVIPKYHSAKTSTSKISNELFDSNYNPIIFIHITDIHISKYKSQRLDGSSIFLISLIEYKPDFFLSTGDLVDNFGNNSNRLGTQNNEEWKIYNSTIRNYLSKYPVIDVSGNHDVWTLVSPTSPNNNFLNFSFMFNRTNVKNEDDFYIKKINIFDICFILLNDYRFPVIRPPYGRESHINKHQLDLLENMIDNIDEEECIVLSHYPVDRAIFTKSSKGNYFKDIISKKKVGFIFSGHFHPKTVKIIHHSDNGGLEFCTPSAFNRKRAGLITIDNNNLIYHEVHIPYYGSKPLFFLTYPVPNEQISSHHIFNINIFEIRVISYVDNKNIHLKIEGDINGEFRYEKTLNNGVHLYSYPVNLDDGLYKIHIYDEDGYSCNINTEFTISQKFKGKKEKYIGLPHVFLGIRFLLIPFWIYLLIIIIPFKPELNLTIVKNIEKYIEGDKNNININCFLLILYLFFLSPFFLRERFQAIHKVLRYSIFIAFLYPLVLPIHFQTRFNGIICYTFLVFVVVGSYKVIYESWAVQITLIYYASIIFPYTFFASGKKYYQKKSIIIILINSTITIGCFLFGFLINFITIAQSLSFALLFFTTAFVIIWVILFILFLIFYFFKLSS